MRVCQRRACSVYPADLGLAAAADETYICGMPIDGFGAIRTALTYPNNFGRISAMSSVLIIYDISHMKADDNGVANYDYYSECFGRLETAEQSKVNPETLALLCILLIIMLFSEIMPNTIAAMCGGFEYL